MKTGQDIVGAENHISMVFVRSKGDTDAARAEILKLDPQNRIRSMSEYVSLMNSSNLPELKPFIKTMVGLGIVISFLVVLMNTSPPRPPASEEPTQDSPRNAAKRSPAVNAALATPFVRAQQLDSSKEFTPTAAANKKTDTR